MSKERLKISVNGVEWSANPKRKEVPCSICKVPTTGCIDRTPLCIDHGMAELMRPIAEFRDRLSEMYRILAP